MNTPAKVDISTGMIPGFRADASGTFSRRATDHRDAMRLRGLWDIAASDPAARIEHDL